MTGVAGKIAVVTGGSSGIGRAIALSLGRAEAKVIVAARNPQGKAGGYDEGGEQPVVDLLRSEGREACFLATDVSRGADIDALAAFAVKTYGAVDIWVNNAGAMPQPRNFCDFSEAEMDSLLTTNSKSVWHGIRAAARQMMVLKRGGSIINVLSTAALRPHPHQSIYNISKAAAWQATLCAAVEFGSLGIRVNGVCPTIVKTAATRAFIEADFFSDWFRSVAAMGSPVEATQVADAVLFLAGDAASAITGAMLTVDAGEMLGAPAAALPGA